MKYRQLTVVGVAFLCTLFVGEVFAQRSSKYFKQKRKNKIISKYRGGFVGGDKFAPFSYVSLSINTLNYFGDLAPIRRPASADISLTRPGVGIEYGYQFHQSMALKAAINYGRLVGDDYSSNPSNEKSSQRYARNLSFRNDIVEMSVGLQLYLFPDYGGTKFRPKFNAYLYAGGAIYYSNPKAKTPDADYQANPDGSVPLPDGISAGKWVNLRELQTEGVKYNAFQIAIPMAVGMEFYLNERFSAGVEFGVRKLFNDYIDDVSGNYKDLGYFTNPLSRIMSSRSTEPVAATSSKTREVPFPYVQNTFSNGEKYWTAHSTGVENEIRGNPSSNDLYFLSQLKLKYILNPTRSPGRPSRGGPIFKYRGRAKFR